MLVNLIILLVIVVILFNSVVYSVQHICPAESVKIKYIRAGRIAGTGLKNVAGIETIGLKLDSDVPCGIYRVETPYGNAVLFVSKKSLRMGDLRYSQNMLEKAPETRKDINDADLFDLWNLDRITDRSNDFVNTYNRGCC
jgi:hypothetical protein